MFQEVTERREDELVIPHAIGGSYLVIDTLIPVVVPKVFLMVYSGCNKEASVHLEIKWRLWRRQVRKGQD